MCFKMVLVFQAVQGFVVYISHNHFTQLTFDNLC